MKTIAVLLLCLVPVVVFAQPDVAKRGAAITVKVASFDEAQNALGALVQKHGGMLADRHRVSSLTGQHSGWSRVAVPKANLDAFLVDIRALGKIYGERVTLADSSDEYVSLGHRAERLRQHEQRLQGILSSGRRLRGSDILYVQERLFRASVDEDLLTQQRDSLARQALTSSVLVDFFEPSPIKAQPRGILGRTGAAFTEALRGLAFSLLGSLETILRLLVWVIILWLLWRIFRRPFSNAAKKFWASTSFAPTQSSVEASPKQPEAPVAEP